MYFYQLEKLKRVLIGLFPLVAVNVQLRRSCFHIFRPQERGHILEKLVWKMSTELTWLIEWLRIILGRYHLLSRMALVLVWPRFLVSFYTNVLVFEHVVHTSDSPTRSAFGLFILN